MKKSVFSFLTVLAMVFFTTVSLTSCSDDDNEQTTGNGIDKELLFGQWVLIKDVTDMGGETDTEEYPVESKEEILTFDADGTCSSEWPSENQTDNGTWVLSEDGKLTISMNGDVMSLTVKELTSSRLVIYYEEVFEDMGEVIHFKSEMTYARL